MLGRPNQTSKWSARWPPRSLNESDNRPALAAPVESVNEDEASGEGETRQQRSLEEGKKELMSDPQERLNDYPRFLNGYAQPPCSYS